MIKEGISIVVPTYNEEEGVELTLNNLKVEMDKNAIPYEIIVVNDGSTDNTGEILKKIDVKVITLPCNCGYGYAIKKGVSIAKYNLILITDSDGTYAPSEIRKLLVYADDFHMVVGARTGSNYWGTVIKRTLRIIFLWLVRYITAVKVPDPNSGLRIFRKELVSEFSHLLGNKFSFSTSITLATIYSGYLVKYVPIDYHKRLGKTKIMHLRDAVGALQLLMHASMYFDPVKVILPISILFFVFFIMALAAAEVAVGLAIIVMIYRNTNSTDVNILNKLKW